MSEVNRETGMCCFSSLVCIVHEDDYEGTRLYSSHSVVGKRARLGNFERAC